MIDLKLNQMTCGRIQLNRKDHGKVEIKSNDLWHT
jgi:hypothetical protein